MKKPNYHHHRYANFIADMQGVPVHIVGAVMLLTAHAWMRWNPEQHPFPFLPDEDELLRKLCDYPRNWHRMRCAVLSKFVCEDGKWFYPPHREDALRLAGHYERKETQKKNRTTKKTGETRAEPKQSVEDRREEMEAKAIKALNEKPSAPEPETQKPWNEQPEPEPGKLVRGLQGYRTIGGQGFDNLLKHPTKLKATDCVMWEVTDTDAKQLAVEIFRKGRGFAVKMPNGQVLAPE